MISINISYYTATYLLWDNTNVIIKRDEWCSDCNAAMGCYVMVNHRKSYKALTVNLTLKIVCKWIMDG